MTKSLRQYSIKHLLAGNTLAGFNVAQVHIETNVSVDGVIDAALKLVQFDDEGSLQVSLIGNVFWRSVVCSKLINVKWVQEYVAAFSDWGELTLINLTQVRKSFNYFV